MNRHTAALLSLLAACSAIPDAASDSASPDAATGSTGPAASIEVVEVEAAVEGVEVEGIVLSVHACQAPLAASWCEPVEFFIDAGTLYAPVAPPVLLRVVVAR